MQSEDHEFQEENINQEINTWDLLKKLQSNQNFTYAVIGGLLAAFIGAIIWGTISLAMKAQIGYMAIAMGIFVGYAVRFFGAGIEYKFGFLGAGLSLLACLLGNLFAQVGFLAKEYSYEYFEALSYLDFSITMSILTESFSPVDLLLYGLAIYGGFMLSYKRITAEFLDEWDEDDYNTNIKWRVPLVILSVVILSFFYVKIMMGYSGPKTYTYESGQVMSKGYMKNSKNTGMWTFYRESGKIQAVGHFNKGVRDGDWEWYNEEGKLTSIGSYKNGLEIGIWMNYNESGVVLDSVCYVDGRMDGEYISKYESGKISSCGNYNKDVKDEIGRAHV